MRGKKYHMKTCVKEGKGKAGYVKQIFGSTMNAQIIAEYNLEKESIESVVLSITYFY